MAVEGTDDPPVKAFFWNLAWICLLIGGEQLVASASDAPVSDWRLGAALCAAFFVFHGLAAGWQRFWWKARNIHRARVVWPEATSSLIDEAKLRRIRIEVGEYMRDLYSTTARHAIGLASQEADRVAQFLQRDPNAVDAHTTDPIRGLASNLFVELRAEMNDRIGPVLESRGCDNDRQLGQCLSAWGRLFKSYQTLVFQTYIAALNMRLKTWGREDYERWRAFDAIFLNKMREVQHMDGCSELAKAIREIGWHSDSRPEKHPS